MRVLLALLLVLASPSPAYAHAGGLTPSDRLSVVLEAPPGISAEMVNHGTRLRLHNKRNAPVSLWDRTIAPGETVLVSDPRTAADRWVIPVGGDLVRGETRTFERPNLALWLVITALCGLTFFLGRSLWLLTLGVLVVTGANVAHAVGSTLAVTGGSFPLLLVGASGVGLACWPLALLCLVAAVRRLPATAFIAAVVGAMVVVAGIPDFDSFRFARLPFAWAEDLDRVLVAVTLGGGLGLAGGGFGWMRRNTGDPVDDGGPAADGMLCGAST